MSEILLTPGGLVLRRWNPDKREHENRDLGPEDALPYLMDAPVEAKGGTTAPLFAVIRENLDFLCVLLRTGKDTLRRCLDGPPGKATNLRHVTFSWHCDQFTFEGETDFELQPDLSGVGPPGEAGIVYPQGSAPEDGVPYALDFTPPAEWSNLPVVLDEEVRMQVMAEDKFETKPLGRRRFTLFDLVSSIVEEATFHGGPEDRQARLDDILQRVKDIDEGKAELIPMEEVMREMRERLEEKKKPPEDGPPSA